MNNNRYTLEPYGGAKTRHTCPRCGKHSEFARYIDTETNRYVEETVGRCNREDNCGYHFTPSQYFSENGFTRPIKQALVFKATQTVIPSSFIDFSLLNTSLSDYNRNNFVVYLHNLFGTSIAKRLVERFYIGTSNRWEGATIFWQIDANGKIRSGKIMHYDQKTGRRVKDPLPDNGKKSRIDWVHSLMKRQNKIDSFNLKQCLFGEHQLIGLPKTVPVAIVESEKTAIISSVYLPQFIWLACGCLSNLSIDKCKVLAGRKVVLFPDINGFEKWNAQAQQLRTLLSLNITVSELLENRATEQDREKGFDLADYFVQFDYKTTFYQKDFENLIEQYEERAAILEFEANLSRKEAEGLAWLQVYKFG